MLSREQAAEIFSRVQNYASAQDVECIFYGARSALTRFANNTIHQNVAEENISLSVRAVFDGRTARSTTNQFDDQSLKNVVEASERLARVQQPDPDLLPLAAPATEQSHTDSPTCRYFDSTARLGPGERAQAVAKIVSRAQRYQLTAAGIFASSESVEGIFNSRGLDHWHRQTSAEISITMLGADSSGWQKANSPKVENLDAESLAETAARKAMDSAHPREMAPGKYRVILEPAAVLDLVGFMFFDFGGLAILDQRSFLTNRVGTRLFGENISIWDDVGHPLQSGSPFDGEGVRRQRLRLVNRGNIERLVYARGTAEKMKKSQHARNVGAVTPTGHGFPLPNEIGEAPMNIVFEPPAQPKTVAQMVAATERGILVTRLWYIREVDPYEKILTGMTRDGTFLVENGKLASGVRNFRFNQSLIELLSKVEEMSEPVRTSGEESFDMVVPAMKVEEFNFTEVTKF